MSLMGFHPVVSRLELGHGVESRWVDGYMPSFRYGKVKWGGDRLTAIPAREIQAATLLLGEPWELILPFPPQTSLFPPLLFS